LVKRVSACEYLPSASHVPARLFILTSFKIAKDAFDAARTVVRQNVGKSC
jgi:hypothetical protein